MHNRGELYRLTCVARTRGLRTFEERATYATVEYLKTHPESVTRAEELRACALDHIRRERPTFRCSYCDGLVPFREYADHIAKWHKWNGGMVAKPHSDCKLNSAKAAALLAELECTCGDVNNGDLCAACAAKEAGL